MNQTLSVQQIEIHQRALHLSREHRKLEWQIIQVLREVDHSKLYKCLGHSSLFQYAVNGLGFTESVAYCFITVSRKAFQVEELKKAIQTQKLSIAKASRVVAVLDIKNAVHLIDFAQTHTARQIDFEVARLNPKAATSERIKALSGEMVELKLSISKETFERLKRVENLASQKRKKSLGLAGTLEILLEEYLKRQDPVEKARRVHARQNKSSSPYAIKVSPDQAPVNSPKSKSLCLHKVFKTTTQSRGRVRLSAQQKHQVFSRDGGRCTFKDVLGKRCTNERWLHLHHLKPVNQGGGNDVHNLTTLCSYHHDVVHQLSLPIEGQVTWLRSPSVVYYRSISID